MRRMLTAVLKQVRPDPMGDARRIVTATASRPAGLRALNLAVDNLPTAGQEWFQRRFALAFFHNLKGPCSAAGEWSAKFAGRPIRVPIREDVPQRWNFAVSLKGHDTEVKTLYIRLLREGRLQTFYDIGTNYGTHSLPLLIHGVRVISVEPNPTCHSFFRELCRVNGVTPDLRDVALGNADGTVRLAYPPDETWLGTVSADVASDLAVGHELVFVDVPMTTLDNMVATGDPVPDLIKVDTEGHDVAVLEGGRRLLERHKPAIVFEAWRLDERPALHDLLSGLGYVAARPGTGEPMTWASFLSSPDGNFLAV